MKLAIIGSRGFTNEALLDSSVQRFFQPGTIKQVVSGGAIGADRLGVKWASKHNIGTREFLPEWDLHGKKAGFIRNEDIVKNSDVILAFWDGQSKGTGNSLSIAKRLKKPTIVIYV